MSTATERREVYQTRQWRATRATVMLRAGFLCERCLDERRHVPGSIVHHKIPIRDGGARFDPDNCELVCRPCHEARHAEIEKAKGLETDPERSAWDMYMADMVSTWRMKQ